MRIAYVASMWPALSERFMAREVAALRDLGHQIGVFADRTLQAPAGDPVDGVHVSAARLQTVRAFSPDVIYGSLGVPAQRLAASLADGLRIPLVLRIWSGLDTYLYTKESAAFYRKPEVARNCRAFIVEDDFMAKWAVERMACAHEKVRIVPNSLDLSEWAPRPRNGGPPYVFTAGRFVEKKGFVHLIRAMRDVDAWLWIAGYGPLEKDLRDAAEWQKVRFLGVKTQAEMPGLYAGAAVCAFPCIRTARGDGDGIPTTALEAMAMGRPVVVSDLLSASCYVRHGETGLLVPPGDETHLAAAIKAAITEPDRAEAMGARARAWAEEHLDIRKNVLKLDAILQEAVK